MRNSVQALGLSLFLCALPWVLLSRHSAILFQNPSLGAFLQPLPYLLLGGLAFMGHKLNQSRLVFLSLFLAAAYALAQGALPSPRFPLALRAKGLALWLPYTLIALFLLPQGKVLSGRGLGLLAAAFLPLGGLLLVGTRSPGTLLSVLQWQAVGGGRPLSLPDAALLGVGLTGLLALAQKGAAPRMLHVFGALSLAPLFGGLEFVARHSTSPHARSALAFAFACQTVLFVYAVFLLYWERVYVDELTGIPNRRSLNEQLGRLGKRYAIAMVDIDHFKRFNDSFGHDEGDHVLRFVAGHLEGESKGKAYRYGGEEFTVLYDGVSSEDAAQDMNRVRQSLAEKAFAIRAPKELRQQTSAKHRTPKASAAGKVKITLSAGVASSEDGGRRPELVLQSADEALYEAKGKGRNCVVLSDEITRSYHRVKDR